MHRPFSAAFAAMQRWPAEELKTPVIYGVHPVESANAGNQNMVALISSLVRSRNVVAGLHLDHSPSFDKVVEFIHDGYTSVMFEGSTLPLEQNLQLTRNVVRVARPAGVSVEAEVGTIGTTAEYGAEIENPHLADPAGSEAMGETGIDALAVAIGNAHGFYIAEPKLDLDLLAEVRRRIEVPLVLNGGSGIPVDQVQKAIGMGVAKMNVGTAIHVAFKERMEQGLANPGSHDIMKIRQRLPATRPRRPAPVRRHHHVRRTRCVTAVKLTPAPLIGGVRRRTIPHRTSRDTASSARLLVLRFTCGPPLAPQPQERRSIGLGFSALCRTI